MWKRKCPKCDRKIKKDFRFCPYCGFPIWKHADEEDFGMIGRDDNVEFANQVKAPLGLDKIMNSLINQLGKEMGGGGFNIQISTGQMPKVMPIQEGIKVPEISEKEAEKRKNLEKVEAVSNVRRLSDRIVYEITVPGVKLKKDVVISRMENGIEIKAYSDEKCFYKTIPVKVDILRYYIKDDVLFLELKG